MGRHNGLKLCNTGGGSGLEITPYNGSGGCSSGNLDLTCISEKLWVKFSDLF